MANELNIVTATDRLYSEYVKFFEAYNVACIERYGIGLSRHVNFSQTCMLYTYSWQQNFLILRECAIVSSTNCHEELSLPYI